MKLIITSMIKRAEFEPIQKIFSLEIIKIAAKKAIERLGEKIRNSSALPGTILKKVYITSSAGAGRVIFLLRIGNNKSVLVMVRQKKDKHIGANMTIQNPKFKKMLAKNLDSILKDLEEKRYEEFNL